MLTDAKVASLKPPAHGQVEHPDTKVTGLRLRIGSGGTRTWIFRGRVGTQLINRKLGNYPGLGLTEARAAALQIIEALARGGTTEALDRTFGSAVEVWVDKVAKPNNRSWRDQQRRLELHVLPKWGARKLSSIRRAEVRDLVENIEGDILPNRVLAVIRTVFRFAVSRDWIDFSPVEGVRKPKPERERDRVLSMGEIVRIWKASELLGYPFGPYIQILALTAQRRTEVAMMRWQDVDLEARGWTLPAATTKSDRQHFVPLSDRAVRILQSLPRLGSFVFTTDGETRISGFAKLKGKLDAYLSAGEPIEPWLLHDLRRTAATHMVRLGILEEVVARVLNHARQGITARVYALHSYAPEKRRALEAWAAEIDRVAGQAASNEELSKDQGR